MSNLEGAAPEVVFLTNETLEAGVYADFARLWHTSETFVLDFSVMISPPMPVTTEDGRDGARVAARVVSRVRVPSSQAWELMKALEQQLTAWESERPQAT